MPTPKHQHLPYLPTVASPARGSGIPDRSIARWRAGDFGAPGRTGQLDSHRGGDSPSSAKGVVLQEDKSWTLAQRLREANGTSSMPTLPRLSPRTLQRQTSAVAISKVSQVDLWRDSAGEMLLRDQEAHLPILVPPPAHRVLGIGLEGGRKKVGPKATTNTLADELARQQKVAADGQSKSKSKLKDRTKKPVQLEMPQPEEAGKQSERRASALLSVMKGGIGGSSERKRSSEQRALAVDKTFVEETIQKQVSEMDQEALEHRDQIVVEHWWSAIFSPMPNPKQLLPAVLANQPGLVSEGRVASPPKASAVEAPEKAEEKPQPAKGKGKGKKMPVVTFAEDELEDIVRLCRLYAQMTQPPPPPQAEGSPMPSRYGSASSWGFEGLVMCRASFCHMICGLGGLVVPTGKFLASEELARTRFQWAVKRFDEKAVTCKVRGTSAPSGTIIGIQLPILPQKKADGSPDYDLATDKFAMALSRLFIDFLMDMAQDPAWMGQAIEENLPRVKKHFFWTLMPAAEAHAQQRLKLLWQKAEELKAPEKAAAAAAEAARLEAEAEAQREAEAQKKAKKGKRTRVMSGDVEYKSPKSPRSPRDRSDSKVSSLSASPTNASRAKSSTGQAAKKLLEQVAEKVAEKEEVPEPPPDVPTKPEQLPAEIVKAELLTSQFMEPEVIQFVAMFLGIFEVLFEAYCDVPTRGNSGHMSEIAFLRFCFDFGLFPRAIDLQTVKRLYTACAVPEADLIVEPSKNLSPIPSSPSSPSGSPTNAGKRRRGMQKSKTAPPVLNSAPGAKEPKKEPKEPEPVFYWQGLQIPRRLHWITKEMKEFEAKETECFSVLWAMSDWMKDRLLKCSDIFLFLDSDGSGAISATELSEGVKFMCLENGPTAEAVEEFMPLLASPDTGEIDFWELQQALAVVTKQKYKLELVGNAFLKPENEMSRAELHACLFFKDLAKVMEKKSWTPDELFGQFDVDGSGEISKDELVDKAKLMLRVHAGRCAGLEIVSPFEIIDMNGDGIIEKSEFVGVMRELIKANALQGNDAKGNQKRQLMAASTALAEMSGKQLESANMEKKQANKKGGMASLKAPVTPFGLQNFVECLLLVAFEVLGFKGTAAQSEQPALTKAVWLFMFLRWRYEVRDAEEQALIEQEQAFVNDAKKKAKRKSFMEVKQEEWRKCHYMEPMKRLLRDFPELFNDVSARPSMIPALDGQKKLAALPETEEVEAPVAYLGWGSIKDALEASAVLEASLKAQAAWQEEQKLALEKLHRDHGDKEEHHLDLEPPEPPASAKHPNLMQIVVQSFKTASVTSSMSPGQPLGVMLS
mmetsp:Transcript_31688/g.57729  ORF Transcript_31688/g.57729 Transcript_31688/m.57729 type:complete len:1313 (-) Transcript_31688:61-3999(-)